MAAVHGTGTRDRGAGPCALLIAAVSDSCISIRSSPGLVAPARRTRPAITRANVSPLQGYRTPALAIIMAHIDDRTTRDADHASWDHRFVRFADSAHRRHRRPGVA